MLCKTIKKIIVLILIIVLVCCNSIFAVAVSDNDGSAFITKPEFDSLKNNFQSQIDKYNTTLDSKIDSAIASYIAGIDSRVIRSASTVLSGDIYMYDNTDNQTRMRYVYGPPAIKGTTNVGQWSNNASYGCMALVSTNAITDANHNQSNWWQTKLVISDIDTDSGIAAWKGRYTKSYDEVDITYTDLQFDSINWGSPGPLSQLVRGNSGTSYLYNNTSLFGKLLFSLYTCGALNNESVNELSIFLNRIDNFWGNQNNENTFLFGNSVGYDCFSNFDTNRNWKYYGSSETLYQIINSQDDNLQYLDKVFVTSGDTFDITYATGHTVDGSYRIPGDGSKEIKKNTLSTKPYWSTASSRTGSRWYANDIWVYPGVGFEKAYITNWNQLYLPDFDSFSKIMFESKVKGYESLITDSNGNYHLPIYSGLPLVFANKDEKVQMTFSVKNYSLNTNASDSNYGVETHSDPNRTYIWAKSSPFISNDPNSEADLKIKGTNVNVDTDLAYNNGVYITSNSEKIVIEDIKDECCVFLKWSTSGKNGGGVVKIPLEIQIEKEKS